MWQTYFWRRKKNKRLHWKKTGRWRCLVVDKTSACKKYTQRREVTGIPICVCKSLTASVTKKHTYLGSGLLTWGSLTLRFSPENMNWNSISFIILIHLSILLLSATSNFTILPTTLHQKDSSWSKNPKKANTAWQWSGKTSNQSMCTC